MDFLGRPCTLGRGVRQGRAVIAVVEGLERRSLLTTTLTAIPAAFNLTAWVSPASPVTVSSFLDSDATATVGNFTATINWGDNSTSAGTVTPPTTTPPAGESGPFGVTGTHVYAKPGTFDVNVAVTDYQNHSTTIMSMAYVASPISLATGTTFSAAPGAAVPASTVVANFTDVNPLYVNNPSASPLPTALINWGDGQATSGVVKLVSSTSAGGTFTVMGTHNYAMASATGSYPVMVTIVDPSGQTATVSSTATIVTAIAATGTTFSATPGVAVPESTIVANFTDSNPAVLNSANPASLITAVINWGDGQTSAGMVGLVSTSSSIDTFQVTQSHTYSTAGSATSYPVTVTITDPTGQTAMASSTAIVVPPALNFDFSGNLADAFSNGPHSAKGFTNTNRPTFTGTAPSYSVVQLYARHFNVDAQLPLGEAVANANGQWTFTAGPMAVGTYIISATYTIPGGYPSNLITLTNVNGNPNQQNLVYIDLTPRLVKWLSHGQKAVPHHANVHGMHPRMPKSPGDGSSSAVSRVE